MVLDIEKLKQRIKQYPDKELIRMVYIDSKDYLDETINIAKEEIEKRGIDKESVEKEQELPSESKIEKTPIKWLNFYTYFRLPFSVIIGFFWAFTSTDIFVLSVQIIFSILPIFTIIGLHKRKLWGWKLNWILLALDMILYPIERSDTLTVYVILVILLGLIWFLPNYIYFKKRRHLFV